MALLALTGPLSLAGLLLRGPIVDQTAEPERWAQVAGAPGFALAWYLLVPSLVIQILGWAALWSVLRDGRGERLALWGFVLSTIGNGLWLPSAGVLALVSPALARLHSSGDPNAILVLNQALFGPVSFPVMAISAIALLAGSCLFALAIWRSERILPGWTAIPYALHALCLTFLAVLSYAVELTGAALLLVSTAGMAAAAWRRPRHG